ncbi:uncharacterized protein DEA37_0000664 [Paragonimus westermani]|uniref:SH3 domain-containing protein n=1 Tax=Paragonimus westermani TaxID=34504 RepID=A0A5J4P296_9TREM|nr:uncharacterized protein DEA37_0000664 [Paragonimus westermani]
MLMRAIYPYEPPFKGCLKFFPNEQFLKIREENQFWFLVSTSDGTLGCVPYNYVQEDEDQNEQTTAILAKRALTSIDRCGVQVANKDEISKVLRRLAKEPDENNHTVLSQPVSPVPHPKTLIGRNPIPKTEASNQPSKNNVTPSAGKIIPGGLSLRLVNALRLGTNSSYSECHSTFRILLDILESEIPDLRPYTSVLQTLLTNSTTEECHLGYNLSPDWHTLNFCLGKLLKFQQDDQERNWSLHDEQTELEQVLVALTDVLMKADRELLRYYFKFSNYRPLQSMLQLYQSESRASIRRKLLLCVGMVCSLDDACSRVVLASVLPHELIRELTTVDNDADVRHTATGMRLLTLLFAQAKELPVDVKDKLNVDFLAKILRFVGSIEKPQVTSLIDLDPFDASVSTEAVAQEKLFNGRLAHAATVLLLACNWHFCSAAAARMNQSTTKLPLLAALMAQPSASKCFLELVIQAFNRDLDPIVYVDFKCPVNESRINRLICWVEAVSGMSSTHTSQDESDIRDNSSIAKVFEGIDEESDMFLISDDDGQYARLLWIDSLNIRERPVTLTTLPAGVSAITPCHSVVKLLLDLFGSVETAGLVYGSDQDVVVDVITRQLCNLSLKDSQGILNYPVLLSLIIANSDYVARGAHRSRELIDGLSALLATDLPDKVNTVCCTRGLELARISLHLLKSAIQKG